MDDPLSAVDAHVGQHIFKHCIKGALWNKTILFATHQLQVIGRAILLQILSQTNSSPTFLPYQSIVKWNKALDDFSRPWLLLLLSSVCSTGKETKIGCF